jgi:hypothetical protein
MGEGKHAVEATFTKKSENSWIMIKMHGCTQQFYQLQGGRNKLINLKKSFLST